MKILNQLLCFVSSSSRQVDVDVAAVPESREDVEADGVPVVANVAVLSEEEDVVAPNTNLEIAGGENINCILIKISSIITIRMSYTQYFYVGLRRVFISFHHMHTD